MCGLGPPRRKHCPMFLDNVVHHLLDWLAPIRTKRLEHRVRIEFMRFADAHQATTESDE